MTNKEFERLTRQAWNSYAQYPIDAMKELQEVYLEAAKLAQEEVLRAERLGLSKLTSESRRAISRQLDRGVAILNPAIDEAVKNTISNTISVEDSITNTWILSAAKEAGIEEITLTGLQSLNVGVRDKVIQLTVNRTFQDGYTYSDRVWEAAKIYKADMNRVINLGLAQGKDNIKIAEALSTYIKGGSKALKRANVYGKIKRGNNKIYSRISKKVDWRALRLVRSEEYMSLQGSQVLRGENNPACIEYNWVKNSYTEHDCTCNDLQAGSPYLAEEIPGYPHPNCLCTIEQVLISREKFIEDLKEWSRGGSVPYMDKWYTEKYLVA